MILTTRRWTRSIVNRTSTAAARLQPRQAFTQAARTNMAVTDLADSASATRTAAVQDLQPSNVWRFFAELTQIPRPSKHEDKVLDYLKAFADARNLKWRQDTVGNLVITRPGSGGGETAPAVVIQGHVDMVCEKNADKVHDFMKDPLTLVRDGDWLKADNTTLGADNGLGVATALALLDMPASADTPLPTLEALFTIDEETGLTGAFEIDPHLLTGRTMLNLDTEDWGEIFIGCAGGGDTSITMTVALQAAPPAGLVPMQLQVSGLLGGHSGLNINEDRGNAVVMMSRAVAAVRSAVPGTRLSALAGGDKRNAIPREASAALLVPEGQQAEAHAAIERLQQQLRSEYGSLEQDLCISISSSSSNISSSSIAEADVERLLALLTLLPHGALKYSHTVPGLVETSSNLASIQQAGLAQGQQQQFVVVTSTRSSLMHALEGVRDKIEAAAKLCGASAIDRGQAYPGWAPNPSSPLLQLAKATYQEALGRECKVSAIHAGLECGILGEKFPGMDCISYGPTIRGAHSPDERVQISTVQPFWELTLQLLRKLAQRRA